MSDLLSILPLLEALERSDSSARVMGSGPYVQYEIWIQAGELVHWESIPELEYPEELLAQAVANIWMRPFTTLEEPTARNSQKLYEVVKKALELANQEVPQGDLMEEAPSVDVEAEEDDTPFDDETAPVPSVEPPVPAPPIKPARSAEAFSGEGLPKPAGPVTKKVVPGKRSAPPAPPKSGAEAVIANKNDEKQIVFTNGDKERIIIGRTAGCDLVIKEIGASRNHCELFFDGNLIHVKDLNSSNGTYLNDEQVHMTIADDGDVLSIGDASFTLKVASA